MEASDAIHSSSHDERRKELRPEPTAARRVPVQDEAKIATIASACDSHDLTDLQDLALSPGGFVNDELRRKACKFYIAAIYTSPLRTIQLTHDVQGLCCWG